MAKLNFAILCRNLNFVKVYKIPKYFCWSVLGNICCCTNQF